MTAKLRTPAGWRREGLTARIIPYCTLTEDDNRFHGYVVHVADLPLPLALRRRRDQITVLVPAEQRFPFGAVGWEERLKDARCKELAAKGALSRLNSAGNSLVRHPSFPRERSRKRDVSQSCSRPSRRF